MPNYTAHCAPIIAMPSSEKHANRFCGLVKPDRAGNTWPFHLYCHLGDIITSRHPIISHECPEVDHNDIVFLHDIDSPHFGRMYSASEIFNEQGEITRMVNRYLKTPIRATHMSKIRRSRKNDYSRGAFSPSGLPNVRACSQTSLGSNPVVLQRLSLFVHHPAIENLGMQNLQVTTGHGK